MALVVLGESKCSLCGGLLEHADDIVSFPAFVVVETDPIYRFSDGAFHRACFDAHPLSELVASRFSEWRQSTGPGRRICAVCGEEITDPDDYLLIEHISPDTDSPLHQFNYTHLHRSHVCEWEDRQLLVALLQEQISKTQSSSPSVHNRYFNMLIAKLTEC